MAINIHELKESNVIFANIIFKSQSFVIGKLPSNVTRTYIIVIKGYALAIVGSAKG